MPPLFNRVPIAELYHYVPHVSRMPAHPRTCLPPTPTHTHSLNRRVRWHSVAKSFIKSFLKATFIKFDYIFNSISFGSRVHCVRIERQSLRANPSVIIRLGLALPPSLLRFFNLYPDFNVINVL